MKYEVGQKLTILNPHNGRLEGFKVVKVGRRWVYLVSDEFCSDGYYKFEVMDLNHNIQRCNKP